MNSQQKEFIREYSNAISGGNAGLFIGAGFSRAAGFVDWRGLLRDIAKDLELDIDRESDLVAVAQYHVNSKRNRSKLNQLLIQEFTRESELTENHKIIARLPIFSIWTTNYDSLIENALREAGRYPDIKLTHENLAQTLPGRDVILYKMHGDVAQPQDAVLTKDDYERYELERPLFIENLKGDLISKTFLFLGFSFTDPNIDYIFSRVRVLLGKNQRTHYCIMRRPTPPKKNGKARADYEYEKRKLEHKIADLKRFAVETVLVDEYSEITELLKKISIRAHRKNIFVSGSARNFGAFGELRLSGLARKLGNEIIARGYNLVSGFGLGIGEQVVLGALEGLYREKKGSNFGRTILRPFPRAAGQSIDQAEANRRHREDLISQCGSLVFLCGNRLYDGNVSNSKGVREEYNIGKNLSRFPIPIGCTGYASEEIWNDVVKNIKSLYPMTGIKQKLNVLRNANKSDQELLNAIFSIIEKANSWEE